MDAIALIVMYFAFLTLVGLVASMVFCGIAFAIGCIQMYFTRQ